ncbi:MAG: extracellular solute-binding protein, partial [Proteobacteria bacterium]|nr:extracellular solute-binding protein [Pseudomonadota bacterium]
MRCRWLIAWTVVVTACGRAPVTQAPIRFLHTFSPQETELFNATMAERGLVIESSLVPFARGQQVIAEILTRPAADHACPDLIRIDATWLPALVDASLVRPVPQGLVALDWTPEAAALATDASGTWRAVPQSVDGLVVVRERDVPAPASTTVDALVTAARAQRRDHAPPGTPLRAHPLGLRIDGYWLVPWLRASGTDLVPTGLDTPAASTAVAAFAGLIGDLAPPPPAAGDETPDELRRWNAHEVAYWVTGPWQLGTLHDRAAIAAGALAGAPRGGQLLVVPTCATRPDDGWQLARELVDAAIATRFAEA